MSEQEQLEAIKKSANSQERTLKKWISNLMDEEGIIFVRTYKGKPGLIVGQLTGEDLLVAMDLLLSGAAKSAKIEFGEMIAMLSMQHYAASDNSRSSKSDKVD